MIKKINQKQFFSKVRIAREKLAEHAEEIIAMYLENAKKAQDAGNYDVAAKQLQWLMEHMPDDGEGTRMVDRSIDKDKQLEQKQQAPPVQIGIALGGIAQPKQLPTVTVESINSD